MQTADLDTAEQWLFEAEFESIEAVWSTSNYVFLARLCRDGERFSAIYKPARGETPLWDFPPGLFRREAAAYRLARLLNWAFVPPTIVREGPHGAGSLQLAIAHDPAEHFFVQRERPELVPQLKRIAAYDVIANNADRKGGHCLLDAQNRIWGIDHGLCFHEQYKLRSVIWDWVGEPVEAGLLAEIEAAAEAIEERSAKARPLADLLSEPELAALVTRARALVADGRFPEPGPSRHYPWPLV